jgi:hypothetical protein
MRGLGYGHLLIRVKLRIFALGPLLATPGHSWPLDSIGSIGSIDKFVDNVLLFLGIAPTFALYPQKMKAERLKFYFRPQPVDNSVDKSFFGYLVLGK